MKQYLNTDPIIEVLPTHDELSEIKGMTFNSHNAEEISAETTGEYSPDSHIADETSFQDYITTQLKTA